MTSNIAGKLSEEVYQGVESAFQDYRNSKSLQDFDRAFKIGLQAMGLEEWADAILEKSKAISEAGRYESDDVLKGAQSANQRQLDNLAQLVAINIDFEKTIADSKIGVIGFFEKAITFVRALDEMFFGGTLSDTLDSFEEKLDVMKEKIQNEVSEAETRLDDNKYVQGVKSQAGNVMSEAKDIDTDETVSYANSLAPSTASTVSGGTGVGNNDMQITKREFTMMAAQGGMTPAQIDQINFDAIADSDNVVKGQEGLELIDALQQAGVSPQVIQDVGAKVVAELKPVGP